MNQTTSTPTEQNVFNPQQSIYDNSTTCLSNSDEFIVVSLLPASVITNLNFDSIQLKIENSADLVKPFYDLPKDCEKYICSSAKNVKIFFILSNDYASALLNKVHDLQVLHSIYIYDKLCTNEEVTDYSKVNILVKTRYVLYNNVISR